MKFESYMDWWCRNTQNKSLTEVLIDKTVFTYHEMVCALVERYKCDVTTVEFVMHRTSFVFAKDLFKNSSITWSNKRLSNENDVITVDVTALNEDIINLKNYIDGKTTTKD